MAAGGSGGRPKIVGHGRPLEHRAHRGLSDGVFAIAITLLVLDITVPESDFDDMWRGIADQWPSYLGYVTSFMAIGGMWPPTFYGASMLVTPSSSASSGGLSSATGSCSTPT